MSENIIPSTASDFDLTKRLGATPIGNGQTQFRVWAPRADVLAVAIKGQDKTHQLSREEFGYHSGVIDEVKAGDAYQYVFPSGQRRPDPAAAAQVADVHGFSRVVAPDAYQWECEDWAGIAKQDLVIYELHIGAFTETGTFSAAIDRLDELVAMGITAIEIMPVAEAPGRWNWGYDGVGMYAVHRELGQPDDMKRFVDACHSRGLAVLLDVVYNHFGPEGNYLSEFGPYFTNRHHTPWGSALNFDGRHSRPVRDFIVQNALYWLREFRLDGLRLDAIHFMFDDSDWKITDEIRAAVTNFEKESNRPIHLIAESNLYDADFLGPFTPESNRHPWDAVWCDDIMHSIYSVSAPGINLAHRHYGGWDDLIESLEHGYIYADAKPRRVDPEYRNQLTPAGDKSYIRSLIVGLQTHDCVGNHPHGKRFHDLAGEDAALAAATLPLLFPGIPILFMGEERTAASPFCFFVDFGDDRLRKAVDEGRAREFPKHEWTGALSPSDPRAFTDSTCDWPGSSRSSDWYRTLLTIRKTWLANEILDPNKMKIEHREETATVVMSYHANESKHYYAAVRLNAEESSEPISITMKEAEVVADSRSVNEAPKQAADHTITLYGNHAVIGVAKDLTFS